MTNVVIDMTLPRLFVVVVWLIAGCATTNSAGSMPSGDTKHWKTYRIEVGDQIVQFTIPPDESPDWPVVDIPKRIDLTQPGIFDQANEGPKLLLRFWDYRASRYAQVSGTLRASILLWYSDIELHTLTNLQAGSENNDLLIASRDIVMGGNPGPKDPKRYEPVSIGGRMGLRVLHRITSPHYIVPIDAHHYLTISVDADVVRSGWQEDAKAAADAILNSIRIEPKT